MPKRYLSSLLLTILVALCLTGCQNETESAVHTQQPQVTEEEQPLETETTSNVSETSGYVTTTCSLCETEQVCATYTAEGQEYVVCYNCSNEFTTAFAEIADKQICSLCQVEKICGTYIVNDVEYVVCPDDYKEFAHGVLLIEE